MHSLFLLSLEARSFPPKDRSVAMSGDADSGSLHERGSQVTNQELSGRVYTSFLNLLLQYSMTMGASPLIGLVLPTWETYI